MNTLATLAVVAIFAAGAAAAPQHCGAGSSTVSVDMSDSNSVTVGCDSYQPSSSVTFNFPSNRGRNGWWVQIESFNTENPDPLVVKCGNTVQLTFKGTSADDSAVFLERGCDLKLVFTSDGSVQGKGWAMTVTDGSDVRSLRDSTSSGSITATTPGFSYYVFNGTLVYLESLTATLSVQHSSGIRKPAIFVSHSRFPTLARYDEKGTSSAVSSPGSSMLNFYIGVFTYGGEATYSVKAVSAINPTYVPVLTNGEVVNITAVSQPIYYQTPRLPYNSPKLVVELSRSEGGGYPELVLCRGTICTTDEDPSFYSSIETTSSSYGDISVPYPARSTYADSGKYYLAIHSTRGGRGNGVIRVSW